MNRNCVGCGQVFNSNDPRKTRCRKNCGRTQEQTNKARNDKAAAHHVDFVGLDGEGVDQPGSHTYALLSVGNESEHHNGQRLTTVEIFDHLWEQFLANPKATFVGFALGYDFSQWFQDLSAERATMLLKPTLRARTKSGGNPIPFPVRWEGWEFDTLGMRRFKLRKGNSGPWMYINDTFPFWQSSFLKAIDPTTWHNPICTPEEYAILEAGKAERATATFTPDMVRYNVLENDVLARLMTRLNEGYVAMGVRLKRSQWFGPGQAAQEWLKLIEAPRSEDIENVTPKPVLDAARASYYGGWFEITTHGHVKGTSYEYDINSAYPSIIRSLPCLLHGRWTHAAKTSPATWQLVYGTFQGDNTRIGPHMHRDDKGNISRRGTKGWAWQHEIDAGKRAGLINSSRIEQVLSYEPCDCPPPIRTIANLYEDRLAVGKNTPEGKARKLVYNSAYGKFAQSIGSPMFANPIYASLITAGCRTQILNAIASHPMRAAGVLMVATDAVYFRTPHPTLPLSTKLGEWDMVEKHNLTLMMPGVYWDDHSRQTIAEGKTPTLKSRGVSGKHLAQVVENIDRQWCEWTPTHFPFNIEETLWQVWYEQHKPYWPSANITIDFTVLSPRDALNRGKWHQCGMVTHNNIRTISAFPGLKRDFYNIKQYSTPYQNNPTWVSSPWHVDTQNITPSAPYLPTMGMTETNELHDVLTTEGTFNLLDALDNR